MSTDRKVFLAMYIVLLVAIIGSMISEAYNG